MVRENSLLYTLMRKKAEIQRPPAISVLQAQLVDQRPRKTDPSALGSWAAVGLGTVSP